MKRNARFHNVAVMSLLVATLLATIVVSLDLGSARMSLSQVVCTLAGRGYWVDNLVIFQMRMPRIIVGILIGAGLSVSGVVLQGLTRNDLASPGTVGVSGGSGLGMMFLLVMYPTATTTMPMLLPVGAVVGALLVTALVFTLSCQHGIILPSRLLLVGIAIGYGAHAAMLLFSLRMNYVTYNYVLSWMTGTLGSVDWKAIQILLPCCALLIPAAWSRARVLDTFLLGDYMAASLGVAVQRERLYLLGVATVLTSVCVALGGHIAFLGLVAPHVARRLIGQKYSWLFPAAALTGAILLLMADSIGRHVFAPIEVPAGVLVGILGGIYFVYLLIKANN